MYDAVLHNLEQLLLRNTERGMYLIHRAQEILPIHAHVLHVVRDAGHRADLDMPIERETGRALDETCDFRAAKVLRDLRELGQVDVVVHDPVGAHLGRVDGDDLEAALLVGQRDLHVHLETAGTQERLVDHVETVRHADDEDVVQLVDTVHLREA